MCMGKISPFPHGLGLPGVGAGSEVPRLPPCCVLALPRGLRHEGSFRGPDTDDGRRPAPAGGGMAATRLPESVAVFQPGPRDGGPLQQAPDYEWERIGEVNGQIFRSTRGTGSRRR